MLDDSRSALLASQTNHVLMQYPPSPFIRARAFTLIELLVVISITAVLAALILAGVQRTKASSQSAVCASRLRQQGAAFMAYAADNSGRLPLSWNGSNDPDNNWWYHLSPYLGLDVQKSWPDVIQACRPNGPLGCPLTNVDDSRYPLPWGSYTMPTSHRTYLASIGDTTGLGLPLVKVQSPSSAILVTEGHYHPDFNTWHETAPGAGSGNTYGVTFPHGNKANALFVDGHVEMISSADLEENWSKYWDYPNKQ